MTSKLKDAPKRHQWVQLSPQNLHREALGGVQTLNGKSLDTLPAAAACLLLAERDFAQLLLPVE